MSLVIVPRSAFQSEGTSGEGGAAFPNESTLRKLGSDNSGNLTFGGKTVGEAALEVAYSVSLSQENIASCSIDLPDDCDTARSVTLALQGIAAQKGVDWDISEHTFPELDAIVWDGLGLQPLANIGDTVLITYYKKI